VKFLVVHNDYGTRSGEEVTVDNHCRLLRAHGHDVLEFRRSSTELAGRALGSARAFLSGIYNPSARRAIAALVERDRPDVAFVQNLYPLISPSILPVLGRAGVPVVMRVANFRLVCPNGLFLSKGQICTRCVGGREYWCLVRNCERSLPKSAGYALRNAVARRQRWYLDHVSVFITATRFLGTWLAEAGIGKERIHVISNPVLPPPGEAVREAPGSYVAYFGRVSREKGIDLLFDAARRCPDIRFRLAGARNPAYELPREMPANAELVGPLHGEALQAFIGGARVVVSPSLCYETFGMSVAEAMLLARPVIVPAHGVFPELVSDDDTGLLHVPGDAASLAQAVRRVWDEPGLAARLGANARARAAEEYAPGRYYERFMAACGAARTSRNGMDAR
jgi:glycosyltransferase involved in cell wall biosynthesis